MKQNNHLVRTVAQVAKDATKELEEIKQHQEDIVKVAEAEIERLTSKANNARCEAKAATTAIKRLLRLFGCK